LLRRTTRAQSASKRRAFTLEELLSIIIGHDSPEISRVYTHMEKPAMKDAMDRLPDVTATAKKGAK